MRQQADFIISHAVSAVLPDAAVVRALEGVSFPGKGILVAAEGIAGMEKVCLFSVGSDGTDGPTDAAGGMWME